MSFSRLSKIAAVILLLLGVFRLVMGVVIASGILGPPDDLSRVYLGSGGAPRAIDQSVAMIGIALALGTLAEIAIGLRKTSL